MLGDYKMFIMIRSQIRPALILLGLLALLTGLIYPLTVTALAQAFFPWQANGSLLLQGEKVVGSALIGQPFSDPRYFWGRPSATVPVPYNAAGSGGSNYGPLNPLLVKEAQARIAALRAADPQAGRDIPVDLVTSSASGLDPHISEAAALYQLPRVARARGLSESAVRKLVRQFTEPRQLGFLGESRVNVLLLNIALDKIK
jgi:potassium-transporting ATPase KdpC subunit